jgi:hypothetical protein
LLSCEISDNIHIMNKLHTIESIGMTTLPQKSVFYSHKEDKHLTAIASYYGVKIKTERLLLINPQLATIEKITKVTIL